MRDFTSGVCFFSQSGVVPGVLHIMSKLWLLICAKLQGLAFDKRYPHTRSKSKCISLVRAGIFNCSRLGGEDTLDVVRPTSLGAVG